MQIATMANRYDPILKNLFLRSVRPCSRLTGGRRIGWACTITTAAMRDADGMVAILGEAGVVLLVMELWNPQPVWKLGETLGVLWR